uniref:Uncharacterized protein n=1 Tax=Tanacetum cinerariifolium TaxID=118510 RepID=A0A6L2MBJ4_TANCI|nr:hypothetical protein [Tanacetum cinerariifolium]
MVNASGGGVGRKTATIRVDGQRVNSLLLEVIEIVLHLACVISAIYLDTRPTILLSKLRFVVSMLVVERITCYHNEVKDAQEVLQPIFCWIGILKWVTSAFLAINQLSQRMRRKIGPQSSLGLSTKHITEERQRKFVEISCRYLTRQLPSEAIHVVLQLCFTLTRAHSVAVNFLDAGGLPLLLSMPTTARAVCQIETIGERPYVVLLKDHEKDKSKEKEKEKPQTETDGIIKHSEAISKKDKAVVGESSLVIDMKIDVASSKGKGKTIASESEEKEDMGQESSESLAKVSFIFKLLKELLLIVLKMTDADWRHKLAGRASQFLVASCVHSIEARRRIFVEVNNAFSDFADNCKVERYPGNDIQGFVDLFDDILAARSPTGSSISGEASATFIDVDLVRHVHAVEANVTKADNQVKPSGHLEYGGAENTSDDMEHDQDNDGGYAPPCKDDYMHGTSKETKGLDNGDEGDEIDEDEDGDDEHRNDLEEDEEHHLPHPDTIMLVMDILKEIWSHPSSRLDFIFRTLRNGRQGHGHHLSMWTDDQQSGGSNASSIPLGLEDFLVYHLTRPTLEKASDQDKINAYISH